jgi:hypothetical protein
VRLDAAVEAGDPDAIDIYLWVRPCDRCSTGLAGMARGRRRRR